MFRHSRWISGLGLGLALGVVTTSVQAQPHRRSPREVGEIISAALQAVIPPEQLLSSESVAKRGIRFDYRRTMPAFGLADDADARAKLGLTRAVTEGSAALLQGCDQEGGEDCKRLGRSAYVYVQPISVSDSAAVVWVHVLWATYFPTRAFLTGASTEVFFTRSGSGPWKFLKTGRIVVG